MSDIFENCPSCRKHFVYSSLLRKTSRKLTLHCGCCENDFDLPNNERQRKYLKQRYGEHSQANQLVVISQLSKGDLIIFKNGLYQHHAVVTDVNRQSGELTVVEFAPNAKTSEKKAVIKRKTKNFEEDILNKNSFVRLYMPLDCLPVDQVLKRANGFIDSPETQPKYDLFRFNCQHLSTYCKIGKLKSTEAARARWVYHVAFHSVQVFSLFACPPIAVGALVWTAGDTIVRLGRIYRTEFELMDKEMKTPFEAIAPDVVSLAVSATTLLAGKAIVTAVVANPPVAMTAGLLLMAAATHDKDTKCGIGCVSRKRERPCRRRFCSDCREGRKHSDNCTIS